MAESKFHYLAEAMSVRIVAHVLNWKPDGKPLAELVNTEIAREIEAALVDASQASDDAALKGATIIESIVDAFGKGFNTCKSGEAGYFVECKFKTLVEAQEAYSSLVALFRHHQSKSDAALTE